VITADVPVLANLEYSIRCGFTNPFRPHIRFIFDVLMRPKWLFGMFFRTLLTQGMPHVENMGPRSPMISFSANRPSGGLDKLNWSNLRLIRKIWKGNLVIKGLLNVEDVIIAKKEGVNGIIVSNHGGLQLDVAISPLHVLPQIVSEAGSMTIMIDGGIRRGTDILKALALGAKFCFKGRPFLYAASIAGSDGLDYAFQLLSSEIQRDMALLGINNLTQINSDFIRQF